MLDFTDAPYRFYPAKPNRLCLLVGARINKRWFLPGEEHKIRGVEVSGAIEAARELKAKGERILFIPNHSTPSDPYLMMEVQRQLGIPSCFMAAYDVFLVNGPFRAWVMQRLGCFSVDRDSGDSRGMKAAHEVLTAGKHALTIFPEGNVYLTNDRVTPFLEGAAFLAFKAQKVLGEGNPIHAVPVSIKLTHVSDARPVVMGQLDQLAKEAGSGLNREVPPLAELLRIGSLHLTDALRQHGYLKADEHIDATQDELHDELQAIAGTIIANLEEKINVPARSKDNLLARFRRVRTAIHQVRTDPEQKERHGVASSWADEALLALRIMGYSEPYVGEHPTLDRFSETVDKLLQDVYSRPHHALAERHCLVEIGEPVPLAERLEAASGRLRAAARDVTAELESAVQAGIDRINGRNDAEGSRPF